jgi:hypothetical protein
LNLYFFIDANRFGVCCNRFQERGQENNLPRSHLAKARQAWVDDTSKFEGPDQGFP